MREEKNEKRDILKARRYEDEDARYAGKRKSAARITRMDMRAKSLKSLTSICSWTMTPAQIQEILHVDE